MTASVQFFNVDSIISAFCKDTKASKAKTLAMVESLRNAVVVEGSTSNAGRKTSEESYKIREYILTHKAELAGRNMTVKEFGAIIGAEPAMVTNNLKWLAEHEKCVKMVGHAEKPANQRGRAPSLWTVIE